MSRSPYSVTPFLLLWEPVGVQGKNGFDDFSYGILPLALLPARGGLGALRAGAGALLGTIFGKRSRVRSGTSIAAMDKMKK